MSRLKIDLVAPPFHGHLHPILALGKILREFAEVRVLTTPSQEDDVRSVGFRCVPILRDEEARVWGIPNTSAPVRGRPWMLLRQFRENLDLQDNLRKQLDRIWADDQPHLAVVDFTLPAVGYWARAKGIRWWTSHPSPLAIETPAGPASYLGGMMPSRGLLGRTRDVVARSLIRTFKHTLFGVYGRRLRAIGFPHIYRADGSEAVYSDECILALGSAELEFSTKWPAALRFVGPMLRAKRENTASGPDLDPVRPNVLVTLGTHLPYARRGLPTLLAQWARECPEIYFHYTAGGMGILPDQGGENWKAYSYINYDGTVPRFDAVVHHGGAGIAYHCLRAAKPSVVWPQDYDQFDFAARMEFHGLAKRCKRARAVPTALTQVLNDETGKQRLEAFAARLKAVNQRALLQQLLTEAFGSRQQASHD
jgi:UDP:flavonoid glycosyltransferase YjiC (YdhE family)